MPGLHCEQEKGTVRDVLLWKESGRDQVGEAGGNETGCRGVTRESVLTPGGSPLALSCSGPCPPSLKSTGDAHRCLRSTFGLSPWFLAQTSSAPWDLLSDKSVFCSS